MSLFIGSIPPFQGHKDDLERLFQRYGRCKVQLKENYKFGFVHYDDPVDAERALKFLSGKLFWGKSTLEWAKTQQPRNRISFYGSNTRKENSANRNLSLDRRDDSRTDYKNPVSEENMRKIDYEARGMDRYSRDDATSGSFQGDHRKNHCLTRTDDSTAVNRTILSWGRKDEKKKRIRESESPERYRAKKLMRPLSRSTPLSDKSKSATRFASNSNVRTRSYSTSSLRSKSHSQRSRSLMSRSSSRPHTGSTSSGQRSAPSSELQSDENDCLMKATSLQQKEVQIKTAQLDIMARKKLLENGCLDASGADSESQKIAKSMSMTSEEMLMISKHYGLEQPEGVDEDISAESFFGCGRLWPWEVVYYRRLKKGPITTKNYAQRLSQNKEFGIVDKYVRSSSGWGEKDNETGVAGTCMPCMLDRPTHGDDDSSFIIA